VPEAYLRQPPLPSQVPSVPQPAGPLSAHWASGSLPAGTLVQVPRLPGTAHDRQVPVQVVAQQIPCWQIWELQSSFEPQVAPIGALPQLLLVQTLPALQSASPLQVVRQAPALPHTYGSHGWPELGTQAPLPSQREAPVSVDPVHAWPLHALPVG
jgi:hypothetical protein